MMKQTPPLSSYNVKPSQVNNKKTNRAKLFLGMLPGVLTNVVAPTLVGILARPYMSTSNVLFLSSVVPALSVLWHLIVKKWIDAVGVLVVAGLLIAAAFALLFTNPRILLLQGYVAGGLIGIMMLISLLFPRPFLFYFLRSIRTQSDPASFGIFNSNWSLFPRFRSFYRTLTAVWGCVSVAQLLLLVVLAFTLPIALTSVLSSILSIGILIAMVYWTIHFTRTNTPIFEQVRQQRKNAGV
jgi:hypothetical protein